jgi:uncharacterized protein YkwD
MQTVAQTIQQPLNRQTEIAVIGALLVPVLIAVVNVSLLLQPVLAFTSPTLTESRLIVLTNEERQARGLSTLKSNPRLYAAAKAKAADMLANDYFEHTSPQGKTPWQFIDTAGYMYLRAGENLAIDFPETDKAVPAWMDSPSHRANILKADYEEVGIATATGEYQGRQTTVIVQMFGTKPLARNGIIDTVVKSITSPLPF